MERREKILAIIAGSLGVLFVGYYLIVGVYDSIDSAKDSVANKEREHGRLVETEANLFNMQMDIADLEDIALPGDTNDAVVQYGPWLESLANFENSGVQPVGQPRQMMRGKYHVLSFKLDGQGDLADLTDFLFNFNRYNLAHRITNLTVNPVRGPATSDYSGELQISVSVEALSFDNAFIQNLSEEVELKPTYPSEEHFEQVVKDNILDRNLFDYNAPPEVANIRDRTVDPEEAEISFSVSARDPEGRDLSYALENAPPGMSIDARGEITFKPFDRDEAAEYSDIVVVVEDIGMKPRKVSRMFSVQVAKAAPAPEPPAEVPFDATRFSYVTNIRDDGTGATVVIDNRPQGEYHTLRANESVEISGITFTIKAIDFENETVTVSAEATERVLKLGDNLSGFGTPVSTTIRPNSGGESRNGESTRGESRNRGGIGSRGPRGRRGRY